MIKYLLSILLIEALTELITKSEFFEPVRKFFFDRKKISFFNWMHDLLDCGYCTSVWMAMFVMVTFVLLDNFYLNIFFYGLVLHRLSNICHFIIDRINRDKT